ncbi:hypothetical protein CIN_10030 [Commensalibacter intestini A911]|uniref:Uncharacterized protein n=1 Tax=Commensalibacter intestini A911 TaxID=1088868 RepID=G6F057_9PROT|nr:hypothetical protein CIN_10030 [Commensalibacter intestini A911]
MCRNIHHGGYGKGSQIPFPPYSALSFQYVENKGESVN